MAQKVPAAMNISLKALVDKSCNRVTFIEADNDFTDVLFSFMTIPMGKIVRLARDHSTPLEIGCMNKLYQSVEKIDVLDFRSNACRDMLLLPCNAADIYCKNLKLKVYNTEPTRYFVHFCRVLSERRLSYYAKIPCPSCLKPIKFKNEVNLLEDDCQSEGVFLKGRAKLIITDDFQVIPSLSAASISLFMKLGVTDRNNIEELDFNIGVEEVSNLLVRSLVSKTPFTETLLKHGPVPKVSGVNFNQGKCIESQMSAALINEEKENISVKLIVCKSKDMVCYAEVREDFVNLLFSFLTLPLGFILKQMLDCPWKGCIDQLCKGVLDFDEQFFKSNHHKELLSSPKLVPGFCYDNKLLGIEETIYYYQHFRKEGCMSKMAADRSLFPPYTRPGPVEMKVLDPKSHTDKDYSARGFLKGPAIFTVTDTLDVRPVSATFQLSVLNDLKVSFNDIEDRTVLVGKEEALRLLVASFVSNSALTNAFLREPKEQAIKQEQ